MEYQRAIRSAQQEQSRRLASSPPKTSLNHVRAHPFLKLQRAMGNQAVLNMLHSHSAQIDTPTRTFIGLLFGQDFSQLPVHPPAAGTIQARLAINRAGEGYEQEAGRVSAQVSATPASTATIGAPPFIQRFAVPPHMPRYAEQAPAATDSVPASVERVLASSGMPLEPALQRDMGQHFGHDFSQVRIHTGTAAEQSARDVNANAYTVGHTIVFGVGQFAPETHAGRRLIAHELTHVTQQHAGRGTGLIMRQKGTSASPSTADEGSLFFQDPKVAGDPKQPDRNRVFIETQLTKVGSTINIRFAYPASEISSGTPSKQITNAKTQISKIIAEVTADLGTYQYASAADELRIKQERARLGEAYQGLTTLKPLNIFIATLPSRDELLSDRYFPVTDRVFINANDVGDRAKLEAAVRLPLQNLVGAVSAKTGKDLPPVSKDELKDALLHEALHAVLIARGVGSDAQWEKLKASGKFKITGPSNAQAKGEELVRKFLVAQEEAFVYESVAMLYPPISPVKAEYDVFIKYAEQFLTKKGGAISASKHTISVSEKVDKKAVPWSITFRLPRSLTLVAADIEVIDVILISYPNRL